MIDLEAIEDRLNDVQKLLSEMEDAECDAEAVGQVARRLRGLAEGLRRVVDSAIDPTQALVDEGGSTEPLNDFFVRGDQN